MIFRPPLVRAIAEGKKTQTRRPIKGDDPCRYQPGKSYAVQPGRGKPAAFRITIVDVRQEAAGEITLEAAVAEGFRSTDAFKAYWVGLHDKAWLEKLADDWADPYDERYDDLVRDRFHARHAHRPVWVITFELDRTEQPRYVAEGWPDYTTSAHLALAGEPEALSDADWKRHVGERAPMTATQYRVQEVNRYEQERQLLAQEERITRARRKAAMNGVDISRELWLLRSMQAKGSAPHQLAKRVEIVERKAFTTVLRRAA